MKKIFGFIAGFFQSDSTNSSRRLVGITGAGFLFWTLYSNSHSVTQVTPADSLVWGTVTLSALALGLASAKEIGDMIRGFKGEKKAE